MSFGSIFNHDFKKAHEEKVHGGQHVRVKDAGAPSNSFVAVKRMKSGHLVRIFVQFQFASHYGIIHCSLFWFLFPCLHSIISLQQSPSISAPSDAHFEESSNLVDCNPHDQIILEKPQTPTSINNIVMSTLVEFKNL